jgi:hypothetical protein
MAPTPITTDATTVKTYIGGKTGCIDSVINEFIVENEALVYNLMKKTTTEFVYDANNLKHHVITKMVNAMTALDCLAATPESMFSIDHLISMMNKFRNDYVECKNLLNEELGFDEATS